MRLSLAGRPTSIGIAILGLAALLALGAGAFLLLGAAEVPQRVLFGSDSQFLQVSFSPDCLLVAAGQQDGTIKLWDVVSSSEAYTLPGKPVSATRIDESIYALAFSPDSQTLAWGGGNEAVTLLNTNTKGIKGRLTGHEYCITAIAFDPRGTRLASATQTGKVRIWDLETGKADVVFQAERFKPTGYQPPVRTIAYDPAGHTLAVASMRVLYLLDLTKGGAIRTTVEVTGRDITRLVYSPNGKLLAGLASKVIFWDSATGKEVAAMAGGTEIAFSPDSKKIAVGLIKTEHEPSWVEIWDVHGKTKICSFDCHNRPIRGLAWSPDGRTLATASTDKTVKLWNVVTILSKYIRAN